jgi:hypothetical protein
MGDVALELIAFLLRSAARLPVLLVAGALPFAVMAAVPAGTSRAVRWLIIVIIAPISVMLMIVAWKLFSWLSGSILGPA